MNEKDNYLSRIYNLKNLISEAEDEEETEEETEEEAEEEAEEGMEAPEADSLDAEIEAVLIDFETNARKEVKSEGASLKKLYEDADLDSINLDTFASDVARLVKNYDNLLDIETLIVDKAREFIENRYGKAAADNLTNDLEVKHDIELEKPTSLSSDLDVPLGLGAKASDA